MSKHQDLQIFVFKLNKLEVVDRGRETQPQVVENLIKIT